jgi:large repetitive protein
MGWLVLQDSIVRDLIVGTPASIAVFASFNGAVIFNATGLPNGLAFTQSGNNGSIDGTPTTPGVFSVSLQMSDGLTNDVTAVFLMEVFAAVPDATILFPGANVLPTGQKPSALGLILNGPAQSTTWTVTAGALPSGLTLDPATGQITGLVAAAEIVFSAQITAADAAHINPDTVRWCNLTVSATQQQRMSLPPATEGTPYSFAFDAAFGDDVYRVTGNLPPAGPYTYISTPLAPDPTQLRLPPGLTLAPDGAITGTPTVHGAIYIVDIEVTDATGLIHQFAQLFMDTLAGTPPPPATGPAMIGSFIGVFSAGIGGGTP